MRALDPRPVITALVLVVLGLAVGMQVGDALLLGVAAGVVAVVVVSAHHGGYREFPPAAPDRAHGARAQVSTLTWAFLGRDGRVAEPAVRHLRRVAVRRLRRCGLPLVALHREAPADAVDAAHQAQARRVLGDRAWAALTGAGGWLPRLGDVGHVVDVLEALTPEAVRAAAAPTDPTDPTDPRRTQSPARAAVGASPTERPHP